jgi:probable phosphoglycerate mutase
VSPPPIYFVRHGETDWNLEGRLQGQRDIPLNDLGRVQAEEAGRRLAATAPEFTDLDYIASPLARTRETMEIMRGAMGLAPTGYRIDERLVELTFGEWEGLTWKEVRKADPARAALRERNKWAYVPPQGESYAMLQERVRPFLASLTRPSAIVAHGGVARAFLVLVTGLSQRNGASADIWQGRVLVIADGRAAWI